MGAGTVRVVVGAQYGSEGKGAVAYTLTGPGTLPVRVAGPNAGHTAVDLEGQTWKMRQIPVAAARHSNAPVVIGPGSEIDLEVLLEEVAALDEAGYRVSSRLKIDPEATLITQEHKDAEAALVGRIGSTGKGIGAARQARLGRTAERYGDKDRDWTADTGVIIRNWLRTGNDVLVEGTQGYGLGLHAGEYPYCTSSDCRAVDMLAMAGISPWATHVGWLEVWLVARVYPIRVAGNSGPLPGETTWGDLGLPEEHTTVTGKVRRVGEYDPRLVAAAAQANGGPPHVRLALTMLDQLYPETVGLPPGEWPEQARNRIQMVSASAGAPVRLVGTGPSSYWAV